MPVPVLEETIDSLEGRIGQTLIVNISGIGDFSGVLGGYDHEKNIVLNDAVNLTSGEKLCTLIIRGMYITSMRARHS